VQNVILGGMGTLRKGNLFFYALFIILFLKFMGYLVAVLADRLQAEGAYTALEKQGLSPDQITILGRGYKSVAEFDLFDPNQQALGRSKWMSFWLIPFGFVGGVAFGLATDLHTFAWAGPIGDKIVGGLLGAIGGAMGSIFVGGSADTLLGRQESQTYSQRIERGQYLVVVRSSTLRLQQSTKTLRGFSPETIQNYNDPE
jgi:hypothetical protein